MRALAVGAGTFAVVASCVDDGGPRLESVTPAAAPADAMVEIVGRRLCAGDCDRAGGQVQIGLSPPTVKANTVELSDTRIVIAIPPIAPVGPTELVVVVNERSSNALSFEVLPP